MAVSTDNAYSGPFLANGLTTAFPFTFTGPTPSEVSVVARDRDGAEVDPGAYRVSVNAAAGGVVTFDRAPPGGLSLIVVLDPSFKQDLQFENGSAWMAEPVNEGYDRSALRDQVLMREISRGLRVPLGEPGLSVPIASVRASKVLFFDVFGAASTISVDDFAQPARDAANDASNSAAAAEGAAGLNEYDSVAQGEAATAAGGRFAVRTAQAGVLLVYQRTLGGSVFIRTVLSGEYLASAEAGAFIGGRNGKSLQENIYNLAPQNYVNSRMSRLSGEGYPSGPWDVRPRFTSPYRGGDFFSQDHGYDVSWRPSPGKWVKKSDGTDIPPGVPGAIWELRCISPTEVKAYSNMVEAPMLDVFFADYSARLIDDRVTHANHWGIKYDGTSTYPGLRLSAAKDAALAAAGELTVVWEFVCTDTSVRQIMFHWGNSASEGQNRVLAARLPSGEANASLRRTMEVQADIAAATVLQLRNGTQAEADIVNLPVMNAMTTKGGNHRLQERASGEVQDTAAGLAAGLNRVRIGGSNTGAQLPRGYLRRIWCYAAARQNPFLVPADGTRWRFGGAAWTVQATPNPKCIAPFFNRAENGLRVTLGRDDIWPGDLPDRPYARRCELRNNTTMLNGVTYWSELVVRVIQNGTGTDPTDFAIMSQYHPGSGNGAITASPWLNISLTNKKTVGEGIRIAALSSNASGVLSPVQAGMLLGDDFAKGRIYRFLVMSKKGLFDGALDVFAGYYDDQGVFVPRPVPILSVRGQVGYNEATDAGYEKRGLYFATPQDTTIVDYLSIQSVTTDDLSARILYPPALPAWLDF